MTENKARIAVFVSGGGTNLQSLIDAAGDGRLDAEIALVVSSLRKAYGLTRATDAGIPTLVFKDKKYSSPEEAGSDLLAKLEDHQIDYIALSGYMRLLPAAVVTAFRNRIVNVHPALLPKYGGQGMYGHHVHEAVLAAGDTESGATVHLADEIYDNGRILEQSTVAVLPDDTPETLAARILVQEHELYPRVLQKLIEGKYDSH
jgi:phosphoribosylglycinamide formyltransferase-1